MIKILEINNSHLTNVDNAIIDFINEKTDFFCQNSIIAIAKECGVSCASLSRFAQKNQFVTFRNLQKIIEQRRLYQKENYKISLGQTLKDTINNIKTYNIYAINETISSLDENALKMLINDIIKAKRLFIFGVGSSQIACQELSNNLQKIRFNIIAEQDFHNQLLVIPSLTKDDHIILFSKSGKTREIMEIIKNAILFKIPVSLITSNTKCGYENFLHNKLLFRTLEQTKRYSAVSSKITQLLFVDIIFNQVVASNVKYEKMITMGTNVIKNWNRAK